MATVGMVKGCMQIEEFTFCGSNTVFYSICAEALQQSLKTEDPRPFLIWK